MSSIHNIMKAECKRLCPKKYRSNVLNVVSLTKTITNIYGHKMVYIYSSFNEEHTFAIFMAK